MSDRNSFGRLASPPSLVRLAPGACSTSPPSGTINYRKERNVTAFTPGPWGTTRRGGKRSRIFAQEMGITIALTLAGWPAPVDKANARLIATAPDLYTWMERVLGNLSDLTEDQIATLQAEGEALLAKARGER